MVRQDRRAVLQAVSWHFRPLESYISIDPGEWRRFLAPIRVLRFQLNPPLKPPHLGGFIFWLILKLLNTEWLCKENAGIRLSQVPAFSLHEPSWARTADQ